MSAENEDNKVILLDETGNEMEFEVIDIIKVESNEYAILLPMEDNENEEAIILKVGVDENGEDILYEIESDEEWELVANTWQAGVEDNNDLQ